MPMYNGNYVAPVWINDMAPAINDTELLAMSQTIQASQILTGSGAPTQYTSGVPGQRYADTSTTPYTIYRLVTAAQDANVWAPDTDANGNLALDYNSSSTYATGAYCIHSGMLYRCKTAITQGEPWTAAHWTRAYAAVDLASHVGNKNNPHNVTAAQVGLGSVDNVRQYSESNPPPYPVTSVNGSTGAVTVSVPQAATETPVMDGNGAVGTSTKFAREDHEHPNDTSKQDAIKTGTVTLSATWSGSSSPFKQTVTVTGVTVTSNSKVDLQPTAAQIETLISAGVTSMVVENNSGTLTVYAIGSAPSEAMTLQCTVEEVT